MWYCNCTSLSYMFLGYALHQPLRTAPYEMYITDMKVRMPSHPQRWARIDNCRYDPAQATLQTRLVFKDLSITGLWKQRAIPTCHILPKKGFIPFRWIFLLLLYDSFYKTYYRFKTLLERANCEVFVVEG